MKFETLVYLNVYSLEEDNKDKLTTLSGLISLRYEENGEPELWLDVNIEVVRYFLVRGYLTAKEAETILEKADTIVLF